MVAFLRKENPVESENRANCRTSWERDGKTPKWNRAKLQRHRETRMKNMKGRISDTQEVQRHRWKKYGGFSKLKNTLGDMRKQLLKCFSVFVELTQFSKSLGFFPSV